MRYPDFLKDNGRIGFIAPSFGCTTEPYKTCFESALQYFQNLGYGTVVGDNCFAEDGIGKSSTPENCGAEINDFFLNDKSDIVMSVGGGETMCEDLPFVDFEKIAKAKPKWFMGYSDNTNLTFLLSTICDTASLYSVCATGFGKGEIHKCVDDTFEFVRGNRLSFSNYEEWEFDPHVDPSLDNPVDESVEYILKPYKQSVFSGDRISCEERFSGRMIGGCLDCLANLVGTRFDKVKEFNRKYQDDGIIWFLESCDLNVMSIRRALWQLKNAGWFENVKGFLIGRPLHYENTFGDFDRIDAVRGILGDFGVPIVMDIDLGHLFPTMPFVSGGYANVHARENCLRVEYLLK